ncbi:unnamed protein product [Nesidiocoris tenuis]|uniref:Uncharacterized protein n=1 Tax=Nesidiocoris tenuis TaxID=355587 RepID=A0A6H5FXJ8_9HEMI|nr:unnamed protein product [Nesidiocoris tenuis]
MHNHAIVKTERKLREKRRDSRIADDERLETLPNDAPMTTASYFDTDILENCEIYYMCEEESREDEEDSRSAVYEDLKGIFKTLKDKVMNESDTFLEPVRKFVDSFNNLCSSDNSLVSALRYFGDLGNFPTSDDDECRDEEDASHLVAQDNDINSSHNVMNKIYNGSFEFDDYENEIVFTSVADGEE